MKRNRIVSAFTFNGVFASGIAAAGLWGQPVLGQIIPNPSFEFDHFTVAPGYISSNTPITSWTGTPPERVGLNPSGGSPFANNFTIPNGNNAAFIQPNAIDPLTPFNLKVESLWKAKPWPLASRFSAACP